MDVSDYDDEYDETFDKDSVSVYYLDTDIDSMSCSQYANLTADETSAVGQLFFQIKLL